MALFKNKFLILYYFYKKQKNIMLGVRAESVL